MQTTGELEWFGNEIIRSLVRPRDFAGDLAREHYGLAGVLVVLLSGIGLSIGIDLLVLASKGIPAIDFIPRMLTDALMLGVRLAVTAAVVASIASGLVRVVGRRGGTLDQLFTAITFALAPLVLVPVPGLVTAIATMPFTLVLAAGLVLLLVVRVVIGLALNIWAILPPAIATISLVLVIVLSGFVLNDQVSRMRFLTYAMAPQFVPDFSVAPATGESVEMLGYELTLPAGWKNATTGVAGEAGRFQSSEATLVVARARGAALDTADTYADTIGSRERVGVHDIWHERDVVRINGVLVVDDRYGGNYEGRTVLWRQFTAVPGAQGLALVYRVVEPTDRNASLAEAAAIAATWRITSQGR